MSVDAEAEVFAPDPVTERVIQASKRTIHDNHQKMI
jgi:hypothetical protein